MMDRRALALLETAIRPTTSVGERTNALSLLHTIAEKSGGVGKIFTEKAEQSARPFVPYAQKRDNIARLEAEVSERDNRISVLESDVTRLAKEIASLKSQNTALVEASRKSLRLREDGSMGYTEWARAVSGRMGSYHNWQQAFEDQTGLPKGRIQSFRSRGGVDPEYVAAVARLVPIVPVARYKEKWTLPEVRRLRQLTEEGKTEREQAGLLTKDFDRVITEGMIKRIKLDSRARKGVFTNPAFGPEIGRSRK